ncbi:MAG: class I SAM-dependent methyltransferase [Burkholderiaceae bacterium]
MTLDRYSMLQPDVWQLVHERQRAILQGLAARGWHDLAALRLAEVGCGAGGNLLDLLRMGFVAEHLIGADIDPRRLAIARARLPAAVALWGGDAADAPVDPASQDIVLQATVFSSLLHDGDQARLADAMWRWLKPGGVVLWYDFTVDNPANRAVRGVPLARLRQLFPAGRVQHQRITLAPPIARRVARLHPSLYTVFNALPPLRTHLLAWITKPT